MPVGVWPPSSAQCCVKHPFGRAPSSPLYGGDPLCPLTHTWTLGLSRVSAVSNEQVCVWIAGFPGVIPRVKWLDRVRVCRVS